MQMGERGRVSSLRILPLPLTSGLGALAAARRHLLQYSILCYIIKYISYINDFETLLDYFWLATIYRNVHRTIHDLGKRPCTPRTPYPCTKATASSTPARLQRSPKTPMSRPRVKTPDPGSNADPARVERLASCCIGSPLGSESACGIRKGKRSRTSPLPSPPS